jgi:hypothetical protein
MPTIAEAERICRDIARATEGILGWEWDDRFEVAIAAFSSAHETKVREILEADLRVIWLVDTVDDAPARVREITKVMGLRPGQALFATDDDAEATVFGAWWPWGGGKTISIRIGVVAADPGTHAEATKTWFGL